MGLFRRLSLSARGRSFRGRVVVHTTLSEGCNIPTKMATKEKKGGFFSMLKGHSKSKDSETPKKAIDDSKDSADSKSVKRRDSAKLPSASKLLRSLRPDRTSPAYHSEGKGLRKRKQAWTSERDLPQGESGKKTAERSRSFSERPKFESIQDLTILSQTDSTLSDFDNSGVEKSFVDNVFDEIEPVDDGKKAERKKKESDVKRERQERKLTKDSGYETSNSDYANPDTLKSIREVENSTESIYANLQEIQEGYSARETNFFGCEEESPKASPQNARKTDAAFGSEKAVPDDTINAIETEKNTDRNHGDNEEPYHPPQRTETVQLAPGMTGSKSTPNLDAKSRGAESPLTRASWDWSNTDEEYASQLRSVLLGHNRQPSSLSSSSSHSRQISSISDEGILSSSDQRSRPLSESLSHLSASSGGDRYFSFDHLDDVGLPQQWDPVPISPLHRSPPPPPVRDMSSLKYARSQSQTHEKYPSWPMPQRPEGEPAHSQRSKSWTEHTEYPKEPVPVYSRIYGRRPLPVFNQQLKPVIENLSHEHYEASPIPSPEPPSSISRYTDPDYARYDDFRSYSQSEGYSSYVSSEASYVSNSSSTPLLDRLRLESEVVRPETAVRNSPSSVTGRESVTTVVTNSSSSSSNDTQKIHGSYSDLSAYNMSNRQNVAHSSRVQLPQRHNSESVLFYAQDRRRSDEKKKFPVQNYDVCSEKDHVLRSPAIDTSKLAPVSERIFQLERQSKSVPNLIDKSPNKPVKSPQKENLAYLDPEKRLQVAEPTLKQIQKQALMNYYERKVSNKMRSELRKQASYDALSNYQNADVFLKEEHERKFGVDHRHNQENYVNFNPALHAYHLKASEETLPVISSTFPEIDSVSNDILPGNEIGVKVAQPPERPPKKPHMRAPPAPLPAAQRAAPQQPVGSTNSSNPSPTHFDSRPILKKPPAPEPPVRPDVESRVPPYHGRWEEPAPRRTHHHSPPEEHGRSAPPPYPTNDSPPALPARISPTFSEPISGSYLKPPAFQDPPPVLPLRLSPLVSETRSTTPDLPPPPPVTSEGVVQDEPLPPPPSPLLANERSKSCYSESEPDRGTPAKVVDGLAGLETSTTSSGWEKHHNIRTSGTTVIFTSEELARIKEKQKMVQKSTVENTYRSELIIFPATDPVEVELPPSSKIVSEDTTLPVTVGTLPRSKRPEEIECDQLTVELANHLPASDKLKAVLGAPELTTSDYVEKIFRANGPGSAVLNCNSESAEPEIVKSNENLPRSLSQTTLPSNSVYFTTSESKAKLLNQYSEDIEKQKKEPLDPSLILQKKEDLVKRLDKKLEILRLERQAILEDMLLNDNLGKDVSSRVAAVATSIERNKVALHIVEVEKITALLLGLAGRLARAQNALASLGENADLQERAMLESKRDKLVEQLDEARALKESIDKRSRNVSNLLQKYFTDDECADYEHFVTMKAKLAVDAKEIDEKIKLGEEQLLALKETLNVS